MSLGEDDGRRGTDDPYTTMGGTRQTRTRMPDGDSSPFRGRGPRTSRSMITVVGVVVLLVAAIAFANRGPANGPADQGGTRGAPPAADSTAATGEKPVSGRGAAGIPSGFARDSQGAQSAAANYAVSLGSEGMFDATTRGEIVRSIHVPEVVDKLLGSLNEAYSSGFFKNVGLDETGRPPSGQSFVSRTVPVGTKVLQQDADTATVEVWCTGLVGLAGKESTKPVTETWFTITQKLKWANDDWKVESSSQKEGPTPVNGDNRASTSDEIAGAVEGYGGFVYAR
ncbi:hypothetical protein [Streptomyces candidus]|uniref:Uncharacterized protein n=1 Tax=Streptomyces candidus TaxID=67283 RepID=A0A7X0LPS7_9ACTN|nr:hypothetical protein [Streptomyces candidus]MBB6435779.1 hypothetical protein [Streptomyces candidus]GHH46152.1 hypothetical protein GCM10018773_36680 [Streptomyces candidus]